MLSCSSSTFLTNTKSASGLAPRILGERRSSGSPSADGSRSNISFGARLVPGDRDRALALLASRREERRGDIGGDNGRSLFCLAEPDRRRRSAASCAGAFRPCSAAKASLPPIAITVLRAVCAPTRRMRDPPTPDCAPLRAASAHPRALYRRARCAVAGPARREGQMSAPGPPLRDNSADFPGSPDARLRYTLLRPPTANVA